MDFKLLKVSHGTQYFNINEHKLMLENKLVSVHPDTPAMAVSSTTQFQNFINARKGDLFLYVAQMNLLMLLGCLKTKGHCIL